MIQEQETIQPADDEAEIILGYWKIRGAGQQLRFMLEYLGLKYKEDFYEQGDKEQNFSVSQWIDAKDSLNLSFPSLPYLVHGDNKLTEVKAIQVYLS